MVLALTGILKQHQERVEVRRSHHGLTRALAQQEREDLARQKVVSQETGRLEVIRQIGRLDAGADAVAPSLSEGDLKVYNEAGYGQR